jgi:hypothetical protein
MNIFKCQAKEYPLYQLTVKYSLNGSPTVYALAIESNTERSNDSLFNYIDSFKGHITECGNIWEKIDKIDRIEIIHKEQKVTIPTSYDV